MGMYYLTALLLATGVLLIPANANVQTSSMRVVRDTPVAVIQEGGDDFPKPANMTVSEWCSAAGSTEAVDRCFKAWATGSPVAKTCMEDMPCWDCRVMGNRVCGLPVGNGERVLIGWDDMMTPIVLDELPRTH